MCCGCGKTRQATDFTKGEDKRKANKIEKKHLDESVDTIDTFSNITNDFNDDKIKLEDYYFRRPVRNIYSNNELYSMDINEIYLGIIPTMYKKDNKFEPSFHPFFYLELPNEENEHFGVVVHFIVVPKDAKKEQVHLYEEDGVEFIEKSFDELNNEIKLIFYRATGEVFNINDYTVKYNSKQFQKMTLGEFFQKAIPEKGEWLQRYFTGLQKTCFEFCMSTIQRVGVHKKKKKTIEKTKANIRKIIDRARDAKYYDRYVKAFEALFDIITEKDN